MKIISIYKLITIFNFINYIYCINCYRRNTQQINEDILIQQNSIRAHHSALPLTLDDDLIAGAVSWSKFLAIRGKDLQRSVTNNYGENVWLKVGPSTFNLDRPKPTIDWYGEIHFYSFNDQGYSSITEQFTQLVWKSSEKLGCGVCTKDRRTYVTCRYEPKGNRDGEFQDNVSPWTDSLAQPPPKFVEMDSTTQILIMIFLFGVIGFAGLVFFILSRTRNVRLSN